MDWPGFAAERPQVKSPTPPADKGFKRVMARAAASETPVQAKAVAEPSDLGEVSQDVADASSEDVSEEQEALDVNPDDAQQDREQADGFAEEEALDWVAAESDESDLTEDALQQQVALPLLALNDQVDKF